MCSDVVVSVPVCLMDRHLFYSNACATRFLLPEYLTKCHNGTKRWLKLCRNMSEKEKNNVFLKKTLEKFCGFKEM